MISTELLEDLICASSGDKHFLIDPITLSKCGHSVCKNCLPNDTKVHSIECKKCGMKTEEIFSEIQVPKFFKQALKVCLGNIFEFIESETKSKLSEFLIKFIPNKVLLNFIAL